MKFGAWATVALLACLASQSQVLGNAFGANLRSPMSVKYFSIAASSALKTNIAALNTTISNLSKVVKSLTTPVADVQEASEFLKALGQSSVDLATQAAIALTKVATDSATPVAQVFVQFETAVEAITTYIDGLPDDPQAKILALMGCTRKQQFIDATSNQMTLVQETLVLVAQIEEIATTADDPTAASNAMLKALVDALAVKLKSLNDAFNLYVTFVKNAVSGVEMANTFLKALETKKTKANTDMTTAGTQAVASVTTQRINIQNKYDAARVAINTPISNAITALSIFSTNNDLKSSSSNTEAAYGGMFTALDTQGNTDKPAVTDSYTELGVLIKTSIDAMVLKFSDAVQRTGLRLVDILLDGTPTTASCYSTYNSKLSAPFTPLTTFVSSCIMKETTRLTAVGTTVESVLKLAQEDSKELASNLGRCSKYNKFATSAEDAAKAKTCIDTNKEDLTAITDQLKFQLTTVAEMAIQEAKASAFRIQNCFATNLQEAVKVLKNMRTAMGNCAGAFACSPGNRDADASEELARTRNPYSGPCAPP